MPIVNLGQLFARVAKSDIQYPAVLISKITSDSRQVAPGSLFVACKGDVSDGHLYIEDAIRRGAVAVVGNQPRATIFGENATFPYIQVDNSRQALAWLAAAFYGEPARKMTMIGVTGTDGKTTTSSLIYQILLAAGLKAGLISTVNAVIGDQVLDTGFHVTTPDAPQVQYYLAEMAAAGLTHVVLESTSHGLAQYRVDACEFDVAVVTNITHEHLDYHGSFENYLSAKARLFEMLAHTSPKPQGNPRTSVLNRDDRSFQFLADITQVLPGVKTLDYSLRVEGAVHSGDILQDGQGLHFSVVGPNFCFPVDSSLLGNFNVSNILAAISATVGGLGLAPDAAQAGIAALPGVPGRMERIQLGQDFLAIVDFAHTPNALRRALETGRQLAGAGRVIAVFGSAGLRDRQKRRMMAETSATLADFTVLTAEDPRTESLDNILAEMAAGAQSLGGVEERTFWRVPDRGQAIRFALSLARSGDVVMACGKGHEQSMCFGTIEYPWDDRIAMRAALAECLGIDGPEMPGLPTRAL